MTTEDIRKKFENVNVNSTYLRVSEDHPLELYLGLNENGQKTLRFNGDFIPAAISGNTLLSIKQTKMRDGSHSILFSYKPSEDATIFYKFCEDIINHTAKCEPRNGYKEVVNRYGQWKKMFYGRRNVLSEEEIQGLVGELLYLRDSIMVEYGKTEGLNSWTGPESMKKDFSCGGRWYEIKSIRNGRTSVTISSVEQLESDEVDGTLVVFHMEKMSPEYKGYSLNPLIDDIRGSFELNSDKESFEDKVTETGYSYDETYDNYVYSVQKIDEYTVGEKFPRIIRADLPQGITSVRYDIELSMIEKFRKA